MLSMALVILLLVLVLIVGAGFLSAAETSLTASSKAKLHQMAKTGNEKAKLTKYVHYNMGLSLSSILLCNTLVIAFATSVVTDFFVDLVGQEGIIYAPLIVTMLIVIYGETLPKIVAVHQPERILLIVIRPLYFLFRTLRPLTMLINAIARMHLSFFGFKTKNDGQQHATVEELRGVIDMHSGPGQDVPHERAMLNGILDLGSVQLGEIMVHRKNVTMINADDSPEKILDQVLSSPFTRLPLWRGNQDNIVGIINAKALLRSVRAHQGDINDLNIMEMVSQPWFAPESMDLLEQLHSFRKRREHFAFVVDEYGAYLGIVTLEDILEEIVGEIDDEHDVMIRGIRPQEDGAYIVDGTVTIRDINRQLSWQLPDEEASTIAGLVLYKIRMIPDVGQVFMVDGFRFEILRRHRNQITLLRITPPVDVDE